MLLQNFVNDAALVVISVTAVAAVYALPVEVVNDVAVKVVKDDAVVIVNDAAVAVVNIVVNAPAVAAVTYSSCIYNFAAVAVLN